jgi:hypothetical protein
MPQEPVAAARVFLSNFGNTYYSYPIYSIESSLETYRLGGIGKYGK